MNSHNQFNMKHVFGHILLVLVISLALASAESSDPDGLLLKAGMINESGGTTSEDVFGWIYIYQDDNNSCHSYYAALPPRIGMTNPVEIPCPLDLQVIGRYEVELSEVIDIMYQHVDNSDKFVEISLSWPLNPQSSEPIWKVKTLAGKKISIGANSGEYSESPMSKGIMDDLAPYAVCFYACAAGCYFEPEYGYMSAECISDCGRSCREDWVD